MASDNEIDTANHICEDMKTTLKRRNLFQILCFILIVIMNLSAWIDLLGVFVQLPLMIPLTPEGWTLPSVLSICLCIANLMPAIVICLRWYQGRRFSEIPYIYTIIIIGILSCSILALFWQQTMNIFSRERSVWLIGSVLTLSLLDNTSSLVFFDYMKRFRRKYLTAVFLGEGLTGAIPTVLLLIQGIGGEAICHENLNNGTLSEQPTFTQARFSVRVFMFIITSIIITSLIAFLLLRWTNIVTLADAADPMYLKENQDEVKSDIEENIPMTSPNELFISTSVPPFIFLLILNTFNSFVLFGLLPPLTAYFLLPYGQKALYYSSFLNPWAYPMALLISVRQAMISVRLIIFGSIFGCILIIFLILIAGQSPCPWWADTFHGGLIMIIIQFLGTLTIAYIRISIGNLIKMKWTNDKGLFYFGVTVQLGSVLGTIPIFLLINVFDLFIERKPCQIYCQ